MSRAHGNVTPRFTYDRCVRYVEDISLQLDGPTATFYRTELCGTMHNASSFHFLYRGGGMQSVDLGVCNGVLAVTAYLPLEDPSFSADGTAFTCTATISSWVGDGPQHEKGIYHITIDVDTATYQLWREPLPG